MAGEGINDDHFSSPQFKYCLPGVCVTACKAALVSGKKTIVFE